MDDKINGSHRLILERRKKLEVLKENGNNYLNNYPTGESCQIIKEKSLQNNIIDNKDVIFVIKGRMMSKRVMGKSSFDIILPLMTKITSLLSMILFCNDFSLII
jgi:lysyl-tRNA synthetase class II